jgi:hypothetical protein
MIVFSETYIAYAKKRRAGFRFHAVCVGRGRPLTLFPTEGQATGFEMLWQSVR